MTTRAVLFDLDGTLADTAPDLGDALNEMRARRGLDALPYEVLRAQASHGARGLLGAGFGVGRDDPEFEPLRREFLALYRPRLLNRSALFPGVPELLDAIEARGLAWGVVTNKLTDYAVPLLEHLGVAKRAAGIVCGDTCSRSKPDPEPMLHACGLAGARPEECLFLGDAERDMQAARAAGMPAIVALYGYLGAADRPETWGGVGSIDRPLELLDYLDPRP